ncbi:MAG: serine hydrolase domain-containing protein [Flavobacteriales bacterium]
MKIIGTITFIFISLLAYSQYPSIPNLPKISPEEIGVNRDSLNALDDFISNFEQNDFRGMVVIKNHQIAIEYFYTNTERSDINDVRSAGKSLTALLLGIAIDEGHVKDLEQDVYSFFSKEKYPNLNEDLKKVKIKHLLDMSSGLDADSDDWKSPGNAGKWIGKDDWTSYILSIGLKRKPGVKWVYADINSALIGAIIEETSGVSLNDYANERVFKPLGIKKYYWYTNPSNQTVASGTLFLSTLDFAKIGVLVANEGKWADQQIIPADYIESIIKSKKIEIYEIWSYGMLWYKNKAVIKGREVEYLWASGNGGNQLIIVPEEELVISLTSTAYGQREYMHTRSRAIMNKIFNSFE